MLWKRAVVARSTPHVEDTTLVGSSRSPSSITVGSPEWYAWLEQATTFAFHSAQGSFTARKERRARGGWYWKAYRSRLGTLRRAYLGKARDLTLDRLNDTAASLATIASITLYSRAVLGRIRKFSEFIIGGLLTVLYSYLYVLLQLEDLSLLFGALGLFAILGAIMYITRNIDWYNPQTT